MAWLKVSFPSVSGVAEGLVRRGLTCFLAGARFVGRAARVFFAEAFRAVAFFIESLVDIASTERCKTFHGGRYNQSGPVAC
jgi:hypothetical protein